VIVADADELHASRTIDARGSRDLLRHRVVDLATPAGEAVVLRDRAADLVAEMQ
jgi:hypothetical protein